MKAWLARLTIGLFATIVVVSLCVLMIQYNLVPNGEVLLIGVALFTSLLVLMRQFSLARTVKQLDHKISQVALSEDQIDERMNTLVQQAEHIVTQAAPALSSNAPIDDAKIDLLGNRLDQIEAHIAKTSQLAQMSNGLDSASAHPLNSIDPDATPPVQSKQNQNETKDVGSSQASNDSKPTALLLSALQDNKLDLHLQPIVTLPKRSPVYFQAFMRLQIGDKKYLPSNQFAVLVKEGGLLPSIDTKVIFSSVRMLRTLNALKKQAGLFCSISAKTLSTDRTFRQIFGFLEGNRSLQKALVIEITQRHYISLSVTERARLAQIADLGFGLALTDVADLNLNPIQLHLAGFRFVKCEASLLLHADLNHQDLGIPPSDLARVLDDAGIQLIASQIDKEDQVINLFDFNIGLAQGVLFAPPRPVKAELLESSSAKPPTKIKAAV